ncbi:AfsR/SARP family transcriptional regulator [Frondihabitans australicus]|nr:AfsR/SARP family transcriptional regulator [Frondihabitans australicus]
MDAPGEPSDAVTLITVLGPVQAWRGGIKLDLGSPQQRGVLAALVLASRRSLTADGLIDSVWGEDPPRTARETIRTYVSRLNRVLAPVTYSRMIRFELGRYQLDTTSITTDLDRFRNLVTAASEARTSDDSEAASQHLRHAAALAQGPALVGATGHFVDSARQRLMDLVGSVVENALALDIELGRFEDAGFEPAIAVGDRPASERLVELRMTALSYQGRRAEALTLFDETRRQLREDFGIDPGARLLHLHQEILRGLVEPAPDHNMTPVGTPAGSQERLPPVPLPARTTTLVGRRNELAMITAALTDSVSPAVVGVTGLGGMGKTALAIHAAHLVRSEFSDGQIFLDLGDAAAGDEIAGRLLQYLGVPPDRQPPSAAGRLALWRTLVDGKRLLLILDNVTTPEQVHAVLPSRPGSALLFTTWRRLPAVTGAHWVAVGPLSGPESVVLLRTVSGTSRVETERDAALELAAACSGHPLALHVAGARLLARPNWSIARLVEELRDDLDNPKVMKSDCKIVDAPIVATLERIGDTTASAFRILALSDRLGVTVASASALLDLDERSTVGVLEELVDAHLMLAVSDIAYSHLTLARAYARRQAWQIEGPEACREAQSRLWASRHISRPLQDRGEVDQPIRIVGSPENQALSMRSV